MSLFRFCRVTLSSLSSLPSTILRSLSSSTRRSRFSSPLYSLRPLIQHTDGPNSINHLLVQRRFLGVRHMILTTRQTTGPRKCWNCGSLLLPNEMFCGECSKIQHLPPNADFFSILGVPRKLVIDSEEAHRSLQDLQMVLHPDKFAVKSKTEQEISRSVSTFLNQAYQTISDPFSRMFYILSLEGMERETLGNIVDQD